MSACGFACMRGPLLGSRLWGNPAAHAARLPRAKGRSPGQCQRCFSAPQIPKQLSPPFELSAVLMCIAPSFMIVSCLDGRGTCLSKRGPKLGTRRPFPALPAHIGTLFHTVPCFQDRQHLHYHLHCVLIPEKAASQPSQSSPLDILLATCMGSIACITRPSKRLSGGSKNALQTVCARLLYSIAVQQCLLALDALRG